jgi:hypothetical protein
MRLDGRTGTSGALACFSPGPILRPMTTPDEYRQYAAECLRAMNLTVSAKVRSVLLLMAQRWNELADRAEGYAHKRGAPPAKQYLLQGELRSHIGVWHDLDGADTRREAVWIFERAQRAHADYGNFRILHAGRVLWNTADRS